MKNSASKLMASKRQILKQVDREMANCVTYTQWWQLAQQHDELTGANRWRMQDYSPDYDNAEIRIRHDNLAALLTDKNYSELLFSLNEGLHGNIDGIGNRKLYRTAKSGTKYLVENYNSLVNEALLAIAACPSREISRRKKVDFFRRAGRCYGRSALMLSGGAGLVYFHHGVVQTLLDHDLLPNIISGSSAGSWVCAQLGSRTDEELKAGYFRDRVYDFPEKKSPLKTLSGLDKEYTTSVFLEQTLDQFVDDLTFQEAFEKTGRYINISIAPAEKHQASRLLNAITAPNVYIRSAVHASSCVPGVVPPATLYAKGPRGKSRPYLPSRKWCDGSFADDLPAKRLARLYGVNHYIVSMINPVAIPFVDTPNLRPLHGMRRSAIDMLGQGVHGILSTTERLSEKLGTRYLGPALLLADAVIDQKYTGDINVVLERSAYSWRDVLFNYTNGRATVEGLKQAGARGTWPKLSMIRNATTVARTIDKILQDLDAGQISKSNTVPSDHITPAFS